MKKTYQNPVTRLIEIRQTIMICGSMPRLMGTGYDSERESLSRKNNWDDDDWDL